MRSEHGGTPEVAGPRALIDVKAIKWMCESYQNFTKTQDTPCFYPWREWLRFFTIHSPQDDRLRE